MAALSELTCEACSKQTRRLTKDKIDTLLSELSGWEIGRAHV